MLLNRSSKIIWTIDKRRKINYVIMSLRHRGPKTHSDEKNTQSFGKHDGSHFGDIGIDEMIIKI